MLFRECARLASSNHLLNVALDDLARRLWREAFLDPPTVLLHGREPPTARSFEDVVGNPRQNFPVNLLHGSRLTSSNHLLNMALDDLPRRLRRETFLYPPTVLPQLR